MTLTALEVVHAVADHGSFKPWEDRLLAPFGLHGGPDAEYSEQLARARTTSGCDESVVVGEATVGGRGVALLVGEFNFLAGSMGVSAAERLVSAVERATAERLPLIGFPVSGGIRMQEGTVAFMQMVKMTAAVTAHKRAGLPYVVYLRNPTTGGVFASWGSLGHVTAAEPHALVGFLGPRVFLALNGRAFPSGVQTSENLASVGLIDAVVDWKQLRDFLVNSLSVLAGSLDQAKGPVDAVQDAAADVPAWQSILNTRRPERPGLHELLRHGADTVTELRGTGAGEVDPAVILALARFGGVPCVVVGHDRDPAREPMGPAGLRIARRGMGLAEELGLPLVSVIDTAGAALSRDAEEGGLAGEIARSISDLLTLTVPTISLLLGEGAGGGALALLPADRVLCAQHAWLAPLPPEGASAIRHQTIDRAPEMAEAQGVSCSHLLRNDVVDRLIAEHPDAADEPLQFLKRVSRVLAHELVALIQIDRSERIDRRTARFRRLGNSTTPHPVSVTDGFAG